ncbi:ArnT family glycosyltransferase [Schlesneria paludicola]|uniref:ArnT family glycosyltransferase n=1 Tax=Schlesneria paludicola TaxID=360056 RepID=UPI00029A9B88|nr:glycosyltransferase family 39 protein [Schlesneria paludicola]
MSSPAPLTNTPADWRRELLFLAGAILLGMFVRVNFLGRIAVEHFDEAVYASNFWFDSSNGYSYPARYLYAPPLLPAAIEWTMTLVSICGFSPTGFVPMIPSLVAGIAMIPSIWWVGRRWFGPSAGLISAWLVATSDFHASYSRTALTDVTLSLFVLWGVYFFWCAWANDLPLNLERKKSKPIAAAPLPWRFLILAGAFTGLAWSTKYNGWLPLAIGAAGSGLWLTIAPSTERAMGRALTRWLLVATIAFLVWSPVLVGLQKTGGYATVAANHRQYLVGIGQWWNTAAKQVECIGMYDNMLGMVTEPTFVPLGSRSSWSNPARRPTADQVLEEGLGAASNGAQLWNMSSTLKSVSRGVRILANRLATFAVPLGLFLTAIISAFFGLTVRFDRRQRIAACLLVAWLIGMTLATPFYHPYPRLIFPWLTAVWLGVGVAIQLQPWRVILKSSPTATAVWRPGRVEWVLLVWLTTNCLIRLMAGTAHAWSDRTGMAAVSERLASRITDVVGSSANAKTGSIAYVWGEPALVFGLRSEGFRYAVPSQGLASIEKTSAAPTFLLFGNQSFGSTEFSQSRSKLEQYSLKEICHFNPSHLVEMDAQNTANFYSWDFGQAIRSAIDHDPADSQSGIYRSQIWLFRVDAK